MTPEEYQQVNAEFFAPLAETLLSFSRQHTLALEKYSNDWPSWKLIFRHPKGGVGAIDVMRTKHNSLALHSNWWIDDFHKYRRRLHAEEVQTEDLNPQTLKLRLGEALGGLLSWRLDDLYDAGYDYEPLWKHYEQMITHYDEQYPFPTV